MSTDRIAPTASLTFLLKHALEHSARASDDALAPLGIESRDYGVMVALSGSDALSQQQAAGRIGIDRTSMVARLDGLEAVGLVVRKPSPDDRRRNVVELTAAGRRLLARAVAAREAADAQTLAALTNAEQRQLRRALEKVLASHSRDAGER